MLLKIVYDATQLLPIHNRHKINKITLFRVCLGLCIYHRIARYVHATTTSVPAGGQAGGRRRHRIGLASTAVCAFDFYAGFL
jgi:hypothetical protein